MTPFAGPLQVAALVIDQLDRLGVAYSIGGSFASAVAGEPRATLDVDVVVALSEAHIDPLVAALESAFYVDREALVRAVQTRTAVNLIHQLSSIKIDVFVAGGTPLDAQVLARRRQVIAGDPARGFFVHSPEDILLQKLRWFRLGGEVSERQWRDVRGIVAVQGSRLDRAYLASGARTLGVDDLLDKALAGSSDD